MSYLSKYLGKYFFRETSVSQKLKISMLFSVNLIDINPEDSFNEQLKIFLLEWGNLNFERNSSIRNSCVLNQHHYDMIVVISKFTFYMNIKSLWCYMNACLNWSLYNFTVSMAEKINDQKRIIQTFECLIWLIIWILINAWVTNRWIAFKI